MIIKEATIQNLNILTQMNIKLREDEKIDNIMLDNQVKERMKSFIEGDVYKVFILLKNEIIIGYLLIDIMKLPMYLRQIFILENERKKGYGSFLIKEVMKILNINEIELEVFVWNENAINFYEKLGFNKRCISYRYKKL